MCDVPHTINSSFPKGEIYGRPWTVFLVADAGIEPDVPTEELRVMSPTSLSSTLIRDIVACSGFEPLSLAEKQVSYVRKI